MLKINILKIMSNRFLHVRAANNIKTRAESRETLTASMNIFAEHSENAYYRLQATAIFCFGREK
jgi:type II secretory pathway component PulF